MSATTPEKWVSPTAQLGDDVYWFHSHGGGDPAPGKVIRVGGGGTLSVLVFPPESRQPLLLDGVRHADDPGNKTRLNEGGVWRFSPRTQALIDLIADVEALKPERE